METLKGYITPFTKLPKNNIIIMIAIQLSLLLLIWSLGTYRFLPSPKEVAFAFFHLQKEGNLIAEIFTSFWLCIKSMFYATIISSLVSYATTIPILKPAALLVTKFRFLTLVGLSFFFLAIASNSDSLKTMLLTFSITVFFTTSFISVISNIEDYRFNHARTLGLGPWETLKEVVVFGKFADLLDVLKQNFAMAWMMLTMVEGLVRSGGGIGVMLLNQERTLSLDYIMALQIVVLSIGILMDFTIGYIRDILCPYAKMDK